MKTIIPFILSIFLITYANGQCNFCPSSITYEGQSILLHFDSPIDEAYEYVDLHFSETSSLNGRYNIKKMDDHTARLKLALDVEDNLAIGFVFSNGQICPFYNNQSVKCNRLENRANCPPINPQCDFSGCQNILDNLATEYQTNSNLKWQFAQNANMRRGPVGINTSFQEVYSPNYKLSVQHGIVSDKFVIQYCDVLGWCDDVFNQEYALPTLNEVRSFIFENKHLQGFPSSEEVEEEGGIDFEKITVEQQRKIEEAYLYVIQLEERIESLKSKKSNNEK